MNEKEMTSKGLPEKIEWRVYPAREHPGRTVAASLFLVAFHVAVLKTYGWGWMLVAFAAFFLALNTYFLPSRYALDDDGILVDRGYYRNRRKWNEFRRVIVVKNGVVISPFSRKNFLDNFRGLHLLLPKGRKDIVEFIERKLAKQQT